MYKAVLFHRVISSILLKRYLFKLLFSYYFSGGRMVRPFELFRYKCPSPWCLGTEPWAPAAKPHSNSTSREERKPCRKADSVYHSYHCGSGLEKRKSASTCGEKWETEWRSCSPKPTSQSGLRGVLENEILMATVWGEGAVSLPLERQDALKGR